MMLGLGRGMQTRHLAYWAVAAVGIFVLFNHMLGEITRLDGARLKLGK